MVVDFCFQSYMKLSSSFMVISHCLTIEISSANKSTKQKRKSMCSFGKKLTKDTLLIVAFSFNAQFSISIKLFTLVMKMSKF